MRARVWCDPLAILIANPNSTAAMTTSMVEAARTYAPDLSLDGWTSPDGPPAIQGAADGAAAVPPLLRLVESDMGRASDGIIIGCFDDTGLDRLTQKAVCPVIGIGQAAFHHATLRGWRFGVVTTLPISIPVIEGTIEAYGLSRHCTGVRASGVPVLDLEHDPDAAVAPILAEARRAVAEDGAQAIVLGCAGMVNVIAALRREMSVPVIDPVEAAVGAMGWLLRRPAGATSPPKSVPSLATSR